MALAISGIPMLTGDEALAFRFLRHSQIFEQLFVLINTKEVFWNIQALQYR